MTPTQCPASGFWFVTGHSGRQYWGHTPRAAMQNAALYFFN